MAYKIIIANTYFVDAEDEDAARNMVLEDLSGVGYENMIVSECDDSVLEHSDYVY